MMTDAELLKCRQVGGERIMPVWCWTAVFSLVLERPVSDEETYDAIYRLNARQSAAVLSGWSPVKILTLP